MKKLVTIVCAMLMMAAFAIPTFAATTKDDIIAELKAGVQVGDKTKAIPEKYIDVAEKFFAANELTDEQLDERRRELEAGDGYVAHRDRHVSQALKAYAAFARSADKGATRDPELINKLSGLA